MEPFVPGGSARGPKTNFAPSEAASSTFTTASFMKRNSLTPAGTMNTNRANRSWSPTPHPMTCQFIRLRSSERSQAMAMSTKMPQKLIRL